MRITKIFLTVYSEKKWLESQAQKGYELKKRDGFTYIFEKTDKKVCYGYVFLKNGRKSFVALDYKSKDKNATAVYGNGFVALFKKYDEKPEILSRDELKLNHLRHRQSRFTAALCIMVAALCFGALSRVFVGFLAFAVLSIVSGAIYFADVRGTDKLIKEL